MLNSIHIQTHAFLSCQLLSVWSKKAAMEQREQMERNVEENFSLGLAPLQFQLGIAPPPDNLVCNCSCIFEFTDPPVQNEEVILLILCYMFPFVGYFCYGICMYVFFTEQVGRANSLAKDVGNFSPKM
jgi:hypothetical protein